MPEKKKPVKKESVKAKEKKTTKPVKKTPNVKRNRKPIFARQNAHRKVRVASKGWRRPRGIDSKQKRNKRHMGARPNPGFGRKNSERGLHPCGAVEVLVHNVAELQGLGKEYPYADFKRRR